MTIVPIRPSLVPHEQQQRWRLLSSRSSGQSHHHHSVLRSKIFSDLTCLGVSNQVPKSGRQFYRRSITWSINVQFNIAKTKSEGLLEDGARQTISSWKRHVSSTYYQLFSLKPRLTPSPQRNTAVGVGALYNLFSDWLSLGQSHWSFRIHNRALLFA